jgi:3-oxoacyl-[acyl-carrier-protein] synthase-3
MNEINYKLLQQVHQLKPIIRTQMIGVGTYLPSQKLNSDDLMQDIGSEKKYGMPHDWMSKKMGIIERRMAPSSMNPSELAIRAAQDAFDRCPDFNPGLIDAVIFCGIERDKPEPATAHIIQNALGLKANHVFDVANACFGFVDGLKLASTLIESGMIAHGLVVTGEVTTRILRTVADTLKRGVPIEEAKHLWGGLSVGDAGGAVIVGQSADGKSGFMKFNQRSESRHVDLCHYKYRSDGTLDARMNMAQIVARGFQLNKKIFDETLYDLGWDGIDWALAHQTGEATFNQTLSLHSVDERKAVKTYPYLGNITTATLPVSFKKLVDSDSLKVGDRIVGLFAGSGLVAGQFGYVV